MNLDLNHVQAFVTTADVLHFGQAATRLHLTQQGLSHRIARLEQMLGEQLFVRDGRAVELTEAGQRFLPHARALLAAADAAVADARGGPTLLRVDVWGQLHAPLRWIHRLPDAQRPPLEVSMRRQTGLALDALHRHEIDAAFGPLPIPPSTGLSRELIGIEPMGVATGPDHPLAARASVAASELRGLTLWFPGSRSAPEITAYYRRFAAEHAMKTDELGDNLGLSHLLAGLARRSDRLAVLPLGLQPGFIPIHTPTPYAMWAMFWRHNDRNKALATLRTALQNVAASDGLDTFDPQSSWLPDL